MQRISVSSSTLVSVGYDEKKSILEVEFKNGSIYQYYDVPSAVHRGLMAADSHGGYLDAKVKKAGYVYERVE
jgi:hypothetical protein